jgi:outer membrane protein
MKWFAVTVMLLPSLMIGQTIRELSLEEAISTGVENNRLLQASSARVEAAEARAKEASTTLLPALQLDAGYRRLSDVDPFAVRVPFLPDPIEISPTVLNNYHLRLGVQQPLFTGFKLSSNARAAKLLAQASRADNANDRADLIVNINAAYWTLYQTIEIRKLVDENVSRLESYKRDTENLLHAGLATRNDLLKIEVQLASALLSRIDAGNDVQVAMMNLNTLIGQPLDTEIRLASSPVDPGEDVAYRDVPTSMLIQKALTLRADLQAMESRVEASKASVTAARGNWWPQVFLNGNYYYSRPNQRYMPTRDEFKGTWDVGLLLQLDLWSWGATSDRTDQAQALLRQQQSLQEQLKDKVSIDVMRAHLNVKQSREKMRIARLAVGQAEENMRSTQEKYTQGLATSSELLDAEVALLQSRTSFTGALIQHEISNARLAWAVGEPY